MNEGIEDGGFIRSGQSGSGNQITKLNLHDLG